MKNNFLIYVLTVALFYGCTQKIVPKTTNSTANDQAPKTKTFTNSYEITSPHGHRFKIEVDYIARELNTLNNGCEAQYMVTNIGTKDYIREEKFLAEKKVINGISTPNVDFEPSLIFEFSTSDGKKIEFSNLMRDNILVGKSTEEQIIRIDAGIRICVGEVKPIRIDYLKTF